MLSIDVKYLFINIPVESILTCLETWLHEFHYSDIETYEIIYLTKRYNTKTCH